MSEVRICGVKDVAATVEQYKIKKILSCLSNYKIIDEMYGLTPALMSLDPAYWRDSSNWLRLNMEDTVKPDGANAPTNDEVVKGINFGANAIKTGNNLLVHCQLGFSRSPAMAIGSIISAGDTIENAYRRAESAAPAKIDPNALIIQIIDNHLKLNGELIRYNDEYRKNISSGLKREYKKLMESYIGDTNTLSIILDNISALDRL
jgi:predicted protein tyrosine phosphatase